MKTKETAKFSKNPRTTKRAIFLILLTSLCAGSGQLFLKYALINSTNLFNLVFNFYFIEWFFLYMIAIVLMTLAFREGELSVLFPFLATTYIWVVLISPLFIKGETITLFKITGSVLIFFGVSLIGIGGRK